jgi:uncharacterized protein (UPF0216 family)
LPNVFERLVASQLNALNRGVVTKQKSLEELLKEEQPFAPTREGKHFFKKEDLEKLGELLPDHKYKELKLPIYLYIDLKVPSDYYVRDKIGAEVIRKLADLDPNVYKFEKGKMWIPKIIGREISRKYRSVVQFFWLP